jgi:GT2 family glycosyltransferase
VQRPRLSIILATYNRRAVLAHTLDKLERLELRRDMEVIVVDNSSDQDVTSVTRDRPNLVLLQLKQNRGPCAKAYGVQRARGDLLLFLDDDSYPRPGCLDRLIARFNADPALAAAGFTVHLPDGSQECSALPHVFVGCGVGLRASAVRAVGGLDASFFMQAEEYDLTFRLLHSGWKAEVFPDLQVEHLKTRQARRAERTTYYDVANNCRIAARYLPQPYYRIYRREWLTRYRHLAAIHGQQCAQRRGAFMGRLRGMLERPRYRRWRLSPRVLEQLFAWSHVETRMASLRAAGLRRIVLLDYGKNTYAFYRGARRAGLQVLALGEELLEHAGANSFVAAARYRDVPLLPLSAAMCLPAEAYVISNTSYAHAARRAQSLTGRARVPVHNWFPAPQVTCSTTPRV